MPASSRLSPIFAAMLLAGFPGDANAHKVTAVSVVAEFDTAAKTFKVELAMDVDPTGDPAVDDQITPEQAARTFATESLQIYFDDAPLKVEPTVRVVTTSDENTPVELTRKAVIGTLAGAIPGGAENFLLHVNETTEAAVVMATNKDGKPARRLQVLYPGEFSNPVSLAPVIEGDAFGTVEKKDPPPTTVAEPPTTEAETIPASEANPFRTWIGRGFTAVLPRGIDFWLFMLALFLLSLRSKPIGWQVGAYTVAHSLALALAAFKLFDLPQSFVLPVVAVSAAYPAIENLLVSDLKPWRLPLVFAFGLFHGLALGQILWSHQPGAIQLLSALTGFNLGVELAQFSVLIAVSVVAVALSGKSWFRRAVSGPLCVLIAGAAIFRLIDALWPVGG